MSLYNVTISSSNVISNVICPFVNRGNTLHIILNDINYILLYSHFSVITSSILMNKQYPLYGVQHCSSLYLHIRLHLFKCIKCIFYISNYGFMKDHLKLS